MILLEPTEKEIGGKVYTLSKFPAVAGREIITQYPTSAVPKLGDYRTNETIMLKIMCFVGVKIEGMPVPLMLTTPILVDNHVKSWETLMAIEWAMMEYNCSFFQNGRLSTFFADIAQKLPAWISQMLIRLLADLSKVSKPPLENSLPPSA